jgi:RNA polymerase sigma-70 factor (ECF subfamily)
MDLQERFAKGNLDAFETLFRQHQGRVFAWIMRIVRDAGHAEDLTVETFWRIYKSRARFRADGDFAGWAYRIATNLALTHVRRRPRDEELPLQEPQVLLPDPALQREERERIRRAFQGLPANIQVAVTLALIEERPYQEIADTLGIAPGTVKSRVFRGVRLLRKHLNRMRVHT